MPTIPSVLSHLATRFSVQTEVLATEALGFILERSPAARSALAGYISQLGSTIAEPLRFRTQGAARDGGIPDVVGVTPSGSTPLFIEAKFWAGLTVHQPVAYLTSLPAASSMLLFVVPQQRMNTVWYELLRRVAAAGMVATPRTKAEASGQSVIVDGRVLALTSWHTMLRAMGAAAQLAEDPVTADIFQLSALCEQMDTDAFLPLEPEELTSNLGNRIMQFCRLIDDVLRELERIGVVHGRSRSPASGIGHYGWYFKMAGHYLYFQFDARRWGSYGASPLWLVVFGALQPGDRTTRPYTIEADQLRAARLEVIIDDITKQCLVPIFLKTGSERDTVVSHLVHQIVRVGQVITTSMP